MPSVNLENIAQITAKGTRSLTHYACLRFAGIILRRLRLKVPTVRIRKFFLQFSSSTAQLSSRSAINGRSGPIGTLWSGFLFTKEKTIPFRSGCRILIMLELKTFEKVSIYIHLSPVFERSWLTFQLFPYEGRLVMKFHEKNLSGREEITLLFPIGVSITAKWNKERSYNLRGRPSTVLLWLPCQKFPYYGYPSVWNLRPEPGAMTVEEIRIHHQEPRRPKNVSSWAPYLKKKAVGRKWHRGNFAVMHKTVSQRSLTSPWDPEFIGSLWKLLVAARKAKEKERYFTISCIKVYERSRVWSQVIRGEAIKDEWICLLKKNSPLSWTVRYWKMNWRWQPWFGWIKNFPYKSPWLMLHFIHYYKLKWLVV